MVGTTLMHVLTSLALVAAPAPDVTESTPADAAVEAPAETGEVVVPAAAAAETGEASAPAEAPAEIDDVAAPAAAEVEAADVEPPAAPSWDPVRDQRFQLSVLGGYGLILEDAGADRPYGAALTAGWLSVGDFGLRVGAGFGFTTYQAAYLVRPPALPGAAASLAIERPDETWLDGRLAVDIDVLHTVTDRVQLRIGFAPRFVQLLAEGFDQWGFATGGYLAVRVPITPRFDIDASFGLSPIVVGTDNTRAERDLLKAIYDYGLGVTLDLSESRLVSLELRWQAHHLVSEFDQRLYQGALAGLRVGL